MYVSSGLLRAFSITAREGSVLNPRFPAPVNTYNPTVHALVDALFAALGPDRAGQGARRRQRQPLDHHRRAQHLYGQGLRAIRDHRRRRRRARHQGRRLGHHRQPEQCPHRADRDHRERVSDPRRPLRAHSRFRRRRTISRRARRAPRISQSRRCALFDPLDEARHSAERHGRRRRRPPRRHLDQSRRPIRPSACRRATPIIRCKEGDVFRLDTPGGGGYGDPLSRPAERVLADVREGLCVAGGGGARLRRGADGGQASTVDAASEQSRNAINCGKSQTGVQTWTQTDTSGEAHRHDRPRRHGAAIRPAHDAQGLRCRRLRHQCGRGAARRERRHQASRLGWRKSASTPKSSSSWSRPTSRSRAWSKAQACSIRSRPAR